MKTFRRIMWLILVVIMITVDGNAQNLQISGGFQFSLSLCSDGKVYAWGRNEAGQIGRDATNTKYSAASYSAPQLVYLPSSNMLTMKQADAGSGNTGIVLACDGSVWQWGGNCGNGNIGNGVTGASCSGSPNDGSDFYSSMQRVVKGAQTPNATAFLNNIIYINASTQSSFAVEATGKVLAWGNNSTGALGNGTATNAGNTYTPSYVLTAAGTPLTGITMVEGSDYGGYALSAAGNVYSWGYNTNNDLGRTPTGADQYYATRVKAWDYTLNDGTLVDLSGIVKMTGGDTHGLAIDASGTVWSWGGDWGPGQRGGGSCGCNNLPYATKVIDPAAGALCVQNSWKIGPWLTGAVEISAGQQHSIVLLSNGKVVTFGFNGSGQLGNGTTTATGCPVYVKTAAATDLTGIVSVSDGDLWSFALNSAGQVYVWGENGYGELGIAGGVDQTYATLNPAIPTACSGSLLPCPIAALGQDILKCPGTSVNLLAGDNGDTYQYTWYSGPSATGPWTQIGAANRPYAAGVGATISVTTPQFYRVVIHDTRTYVADKCGPCVDSEDIIQVTDRTPPLTTSMSGTCGATDVCFQISSTGAIDNNAFDWYAAMTGGSKLNSSGTMNPFCTPKAGLTLNGSNYEIWVDDKRQFQSTVGPLTSPCGVPTASAGGSKYQQEFVLYDNATITALSIYYKTYNVNATPDNVFINVYSNDPNKNSSSNDGVQPGVILTSATTTVPRTSTALQLFNLSGFNLALTGSPSGTKYWLEVTGLSNGEFGEMTCAYSYPVSDAISGRDVIVLGGSTANAQVIQKTAYNAFAFNWQFLYEDGYPCGRFKVTAPNSTTACLHVDFLYFEGEKKGNQNVLTWATASEENSNYFEVQISYDGINWGTIGKVNAVGNSSTTQEYSYIDEITRTGMAYYRIVERDKSGNAATVSTIVGLSTTSTDILVHPNPNNGVFTIETNGTLGDQTTIQVFDAVGKIVYQSSDDFSFKLVSKEISLTNLGKGIYYLKVSDGNYSNTEKLIVE